MVFGDRAERGETAASGIGEKDVDLRVALLDRVIQPVEIGEAGGVALDADNVALELLQCLVERLLPATGDIDRCSLAGKCLRGCETDPARSTGYHDNFLCESAHCPAPLLAAKPSRCVRSR